MPTKIEKDRITGQDTTGHEWDGVKELNSPLPKWWLYVFYVTVAISLVLYLLYPAIPFGFGYTAGLLGTSARKEVAATIEAAQAERASLLREVASADLTTIAADPGLYDLAARGGEYAFSDNCAQCHGLGGGGQLNYPSLADDAWLWGGTLDAIAHTITHGVRNDDPDSRQSMMPAFAGILEREQIASLARYVQSMSLGAPADQDANPVEEGATLFAENCAACHGDSGMGIEELGAPNLTDAIWLYGGSHGEIVNQILSPQHGRMPAWQPRLDPTTIKLVATYVHSLGGGE